MAFQQWLQRPLLALGIAAAACSPTKEASERIISQTHTDSRGIAYFADEQDGNIEVLVEDENGVPVSDLEVTFIDRDVNAFTLAKQDYILHFEVFPPGEYRSVTLSDETRRHGGIVEILRYAIRVFSERSFLERNEEPFTVWEYRQQQDPARINALEDYMDWAEREGHRYVGCRTREELEEGRNLTMDLVVAGVTAGGSVAAQSFIRVACTVYQEILSLERIGLFDSFLKETYDVYEPLNFTGPTDLRGVPGRSSCTDQALGTEGESESEGEMNEDDIIELCREYYGRFGQECSLLPAIDEMTISKECTEKNRVILERDRLLLECAELPECSDLYDCIIKNGQKK